MSRQHLPEHVEAFSAFRQLCAEGKFRDAQILLVNGGQFRPAQFEHRNTTPAHSDIPSSGGFYVTPEDLDGDPAFGRFISWIRTGLPNPAPCQFFDALRVRFNSDGTAKRSW